MKLAAALNLKLGPVKQLTVKTFAGIKKVECRDARLELVLDNQQLFPLDVLVVDQIVGKMPTATIPKGSALRPENVVKEIREPHLLVGNDYFWEIVSKKRTRLLDKYYVFDSQIGALLSTRVLSIAKHQRQSIAAAGFVCAAFANNEDETLSEQVSRWLSIDGVGLHLKEIHSDDDALAWKIFKETTKFEDRRYSVSLPLKDQDAPLPYNLGLAVQQLIALTKRADAAAIKKTADGFQEWMEQGIIEIVPPKEVLNPLGGRATYHPYHQITKKARIVHNASASTKGEISLNGRLYRGPVILPDLVGMLLRFRCWEGVACGDIKGAFLQLALNQPDKDLVRFVVLKDWSQPCSQSNLVHMRFTRLNFGLISSSFLLGGVLKLHFAEEKVGPVGSEILKNTYVDNILCTGHDTDEAIQKLEFAKSHLADASMTLRDLVSNDATQNVKWEFKEQSFKMLGHTWNVAEETLVFCIPTFTWENTTKRTLLSVIGSIYDPTGVLGPIMFKLRLVMRDLWTLSLKWDDVVPSQVIEQLKSIEYREEPTTIVLPRKTLPITAKDLEMIIFVDASMKGLGCCVYLKELNGHHLPHLLFAKSLLAPANCRSIHRLELTAAHMGVMAGDFVQQQVDKPIKRITLWSDNSSVLGWIAGQKWEKLGKYATEKLSKIVEYPAEFRYIPTHLNPADLATRGCSAAELIENIQWWHGPEFLKQPYKNWPTFSIPSMEESIIDNSMPEAATRRSEEPSIDSSGLAAPAVVKKKESLIDPNSVETWDQLVESLGALVKDETDGPLEAARKGEIQAFLEAQRRDPPTKDTIKVLAIFKDPDGLHRVTSRTLNSQVSGATDHPIYMPTKDPATQMYMEHIHLKKQHASLAEMRRTVWTPRGRTLGQKVIQACQGCKRFRALPFKLPPLPPLPKSRVSAQTPFEYCGVDLCGPFKVRSEGDEVVKTWICLFNCLTTRAIHMELVNGLSAEELILAIRRFIARRGNPKMFLSDNATNFRAAGPFLESWRPEEGDKFNKYAISERITWRHIPALSPWQGGCYERMMKLVKDSLRRTIGNALISLEAFRTLVIEAEAIINSRPLTYLSEDDRVLRPIDLLLFNGASYIVEKLDITRKQASKPKCTGMGETTGTPEYCLANPCAANGTRFCLIPKQEYAFLRTPEGQIPIHAWSTTMMEVFERAPSAPPTSPTCHNLSMACSESGVQIQGQPRCIDVIEICVRAGTHEDCMHDEHLVADFSVRPPDEFLVASHRFDGKAWKDGSLVSTISIECTAKDSCHVANCFFCWNTYERPGCAVWMIGDKILRLFSYGLGAVGLILLFCKLIMAGRRRCARRRQWNSPRSLMELAALLPAVLPAANASGQVISFQAPKQSCAVHRNGMIECSFDETTLLTVRSGEEAVVVFRDHSDRPVTTLQIRSAPVYRCVPIERFYTRSIGMDTVYARRCPGMGSCQGKTCSKMEPNWTLEEFKPVNYRPGVARCSEACSSLSCGCLSFGSGCFFSRTTAEPRSELVIEVTTCRWEKGLQVSWDFGEQGSGSGLLAAGETVKSEVNGLEIGAVEVASDKVLIPKTFAKNGNKVKILSETEIKAAKLFNCQDRESAKKMDPKKCSLDSQDILCRQADDAMVCESRGNSFLDNDKHILPQLFDNDLYLLNNDEVQVQAKGTSTLQIKVKKLKASTNIDVATCTVTKATVNGCYGCRIGAVLEYVCIAEFGRQQAEVDCGGSARTLITCDGTRKDRTTSIKLMEARVKRDCTVRCSGGPSKFTLDGNLVYVSQKDQWVRRPSEMVEESTLEMVKNWMRDMVTEHLPMVLSFVAVMLLLPKLIKFAVRLIRL